MAQVPVLKVEHLTTRFRTSYGAVTAVDGVSFTVDRGQTLGVVGESGSGKSVTALSVMRLVPSPGRIESGSIQLNGEELLDLDEEAMRRHRGADAGMVFQNPMTALNPSFSIGWQLAEALRAHGGPRNEPASTRVQRALAEVGMPDPARQAASFPHQMSGGMRQRVVVALGMLNEPQLLIADEPTTALDVTIQAQVLNLMRDMTHDHGTALLLITHNMGVIAKMCDRVAVMYAGEIVEEASVDQLFEDPRHPYTWGLLRSIPRADQGRGQLHTLPGAPPDMSQPLLGCRFRARCVLAEERCGTHPQLLQVDGEHLARCWVTQDGRSPASPDAVGVGRGPTSEVRRDR